MGTIQVGQAGVFSKTRYLSVGQATETETARYLTSVPYPPADVTLTTDYTSRYSPTFNSDTVVDATQATWVGDFSSGYPIQIGGGGAVHWIGGLIQGTRLETTTWVNANQSGLGINGNPGSIVEGVRIHNKGDAVKFKEGDFVMRGCYITYMRDDGMENDNLLTGVVEDNLFDGVYSGISARASGGRNGSKHMFIVRDNLIRMQPMEKIYLDDGLQPGHDMPWKWDHSYPSTSVPTEWHNNIILMEQVNNNGHRTPMPRLEAASGNVIIYTGGPLSDWDAMGAGWYITDDTSIWDDAKATWLAHHGPFPDLVVPNPGIWGIASESDSALSVTVA